MGIGLRIRQYLTGICVLVSAAVFTSNAVAYDFMPVDIVYYIIAGAACLVIVSELSNFISLKRLAEIAFVCILPAAFAFSSMYNNASHIRNDDAVFQGLFWLIYIPLLFIINCLLRAADSVSTLTIKDICGVIRRNIWIGAVLIIVILSRLIFMDTLQRWDAGEYYVRFIKGIKYFSYSSFSDFLNNFTLCGHPTLAFSMVYMIGELAFPQQIKGVLIVNMVLTVIAVWCLYRIIMHVFCNSTPARAAVYALIISFAPLFYGTFGYFNPDYALAVFAVIALYGYVYELPVITGFACLLCIYTKETGLVIVAGLTMGIFTDHLLRNPGCRGIVSIFKDMKLYFMLAAVISYRFYTKAIGGLTNWSQTTESGTGIRWDNNGFNCLGINEAHIITKLKQQFILNFNWILAALITAGIIYAAVMIIRKNSNAYKDSHANKDAETGNKGDMLKLCGVFGILAAFTAFSCLYITAAMARYNVVGDIMLYVLGLACLDMMISNAAMYIPSAGIAVMLIAQCFYTVDPLTVAAFGGVDTGSGKMVYVGIEDGDRYYGDYLIYNTQYLWIDRVMDKLLADSDYDGTQDIILFNDYGGSQIAGNDPLYYYNWDKRLKKRVFYSNENTVKMSYIVGDILADNMKLQSRAIVVFIPYMHNDEEKAMHRLNIFYNAGPRQSAYDRHGRIDYYNLVRLKKYRFIRG